MESIPEELRDRIPRLYGTRQEEDPIAWVKFFSPMFNWQWYITELEDTDGVVFLYGWMVSDTKPHGRLIGSELASMRAYFGITIERDPQFTPILLSKVKASVGAVAAKFPLGQVVVTPGALVALEEAGQTPLDFLRRHAQGDWGDLDEHDRLVNEEALTHGGRLLSSYLLNSGQRLWIITEYDRSASTLLLPSEY